MEVKKEELLHIANLARLKLQEDEIEKYLLNLQDILNFANIVNTAKVDGLKETVGERDAYNVFKKDEIEKFDNIEGIVKNFPEEQDNMIRVPKVVQWRLKNNQHLASLFQIQKMLQRTTSTPSHFWFEMPSNILILFQTEIILE